MNEECPEFLPAFMEFFHSCGGGTMVLWDLKKRFIFLLEFCHKYHLQRAHAVLAYQWLLAGYPPAQGPDIFSRKIEKLPGEVQYLSGSEEVVCARESRYWEFSMQEKTYFFVYNRQFAPNRPAAVLALIPN